MRPDNAAVLAAIKAHATTKTYAEIAALLGLSPGFIGDIAHKAGFKKPYVVGKLRAKHAHMREVILAHAETHTLLEIGRMLGVTREYVRQLCEKWQIERRSFACSPLRWMSGRELRKLARQPEKSLKAIAREAGVTAETLQRELSRRGIEPFTQRERNARLLKRGMRICCRCRRTKSLDQFARHAGHSRGHDSRCLECARACAIERRKRKASRSE